jgi:hypothetical protein
MILDRYQLHEVDIEFLAVLVIDHSRTQSPSYARARRGALAKSISNWNMIGHNEGYCSNTGYIILPCFYGIRLWIWPEPLVAPRVRRALGTRMVIDVNLYISSPHSSDISVKSIIYTVFLASSAQVSLNRRELI